MKKHYLTLLFLPLFVLASCAKQKNCDCAHAQKGKFIYLEKPERYGDKQVVAYFTPDNDYHSYQIIGTIPKKYQQTDTLYVDVCLKEIVVKGKHLDYTRTHYKLECIEKEN